MQGNYVEAKTLAEQLVDARRRAQGPRHPETAASILTLGLAEYALSNFARSESLALEALDITNQPWLRNLAQAMLTAAQKKQPSATPDWTTMPAFEKYSLEILATKR